MRIRFAWLIGTALAYGIIGGYLLYTHLWDANGGLAWTPTAFVRLGWAAFVFLASTLWLTRRHPTQRDGWVALIAAGAFLLGAAVAWGVVEYHMLGSEHPWDTDIPGDMLYCIDCARRVPIIRQTLLAALAGTIATAVLAPLIARVVHRARPRAVEPRA
jgi:hypothetical protein